MNTLDLSLRYTYADYLTWPDDIRRELINGFVFKMAAPAATHQKILGDFYFALRCFLHEKTCQIFVAPFDVRFPKNGEKEDEKVFTVVQPDICIICDSSKIEERGCLGSPDFIIEIVSPNNSKRDIKDKFKIYEENAVREYWIVRPDEKSVQVFLLNESGKYFLDGTYTDEDSVPVTIFNGELIIQLEKIFKK